MADIYIKPIIEGNYVVRSLNLDDLETFKYIRTKAVSENPDMFLDNADKAAKRSEQEWEAYLVGSNKCVFGLFHEKDIIGLASVFQPNLDVLKGHIAMGYISPEYRGKGLSSLLYKARIEWAKHCSAFIALTASHREGNEVSRAAMIKHGFIYTGVEDECFGDGCVDKSLKYELDLKPLREEV
ncbi:MAG: GNAT family N-acetyltransferase [Micavibrio sp.]|nr:GNAT family N-acetyltransferase [Micavibrio sp.]